MKLLRSAALICGLAACSTVGPDALRDTRPLYNEAVQQANDQELLLGGVFRVQSSDSEPVNASIAVHYRRTWFYIPDDDLDRKSTFVLLTQLIQLHSTPAPPGPGLGFSFGAG